MKRMETLSFRSSLATEESISMCMHRKLGIVALEPCIFTGETYYISLLTGVQGWGKETGGQRKKGNPATREVTH